MTKNLLIFLRQFFFLLFFSLVLSNQYISSVFFFINQFISFAFIYSFVLYRSHVLICSYASVLSCSFFSLVLSLQYSFVLFLVQTFLLACFFFISSFSVLSNSLVCGRFFPLFPIYSFIIDTSFSLVFYFFGLYSLSYPIVDLARYDYYNRSNIKQCLPNVVCTAKFPVL